MRLFSIFTFMLVQFIGFSQAFEINLKVNNYDNDTIIVGYYYGDRQLVKDTCFATSKGNFKFEGEERLDGGMYMFLTKPDNQILQFLVPEDDQTFDVTFDYNDKSTAKIKGSEDNKVFFEYLDFLGEMRAKSDPLRDTIKKGEELGINVDAFKSELDGYDKKVKDRQAKIIKEYPNTVTYNLLRSNIEPEIPEFEGTQEEKDLKRFLFYRDHYWDNIDFAYPSLIRTPYFYNKVTTYLEKLTPQSADSINQAIDFILAKLKPVNEDAYKFCLSNILNTYAKNKMVGMDAIYVHMIDKYYSQGEADWVDEENLAKMSENANNLRPILIGKTFPNITTYKEDGSAVMAHDIVSPYTIYLFWAPDCGHCKKSMPSIVEFYDEYQAKGVTLVSVCTKAGDKFADCWSFLEEKKMEKFINTGDQYQRYRKYVYVPSTPKVFVLDKDKKIIIKDIAAEDLSKIMGEIMAEDAKKTEKNEKQD